MANMHALHVKLLRATQTWKKVQLPLTFRHQAFSFSLLSEIDGPTCTYEFSPLSLRVPSAPAAAAYVQMYVQLVVPIGTMYAAQIPPLPLRAGWEDGTD